MRPRGLDAPYDSGSRPIPTPEPRGDAHPKPITNSVGMTFATIPAGTFSMGSPDNDPEAYRDEKPWHDVRISKPFLLSIHPVTQGQYRAVTGKTPSLFKGPETLPVEQVSWFEAVEYCNELSQKVKRPPFYDIKKGKTEPVVTVPDWKGTGYRLPTEAEWEYACRAGSAWRYCFGDDPATLGEYAWVQENSGGKTHPVGEKQPNEFGLYDMHGNVWEWCWDGLERYAREVAVDPSGPSRATDRVIRGGRWVSDPRNARSAYRGWDAPGYRSFSLGFRLARGR